MILNEYKSIPAMVPLNDIICILINVLFSRVDVFSSGLHIGKQCVFPVRLS